jgi:YD repeat-containing protein
MNRRSLIIFSGILYTTFSFAQTDNSLNTTERSADKENATSQLKNVDLSTGAITPAISLFQLNGKNASMPIGINYVDGNGVKVNETAGILGLGWNLNAGSYVKRIVRGKPDDWYYYYHQHGWLSFVVDPNDYWPSQDWGNNSAGLVYYGDGGCNPDFSDDEPTEPFDFINYLKYEKNLNHRVGRMIRDDYDARNSSCPSDFSAVAFNTTDDMSNHWSHGRRWLYNSINKQCDVLNFDSEPDLFIYNLNGITGSFVLDENGVPLNLQENGVAILSSPFPSGQWKLETPDGTVFNFNNTNVDLVNENTNTGVANSEYTSRLDEAHTAMSYINAWYVQSIQSSYNETFTFEYEDYNFPSQSIISAHDMLFWGIEMNGPIGQGDVYADLITHFTAPSFNYENHSSNTTISYSSKQRLKAIEIDNERINITYNPTNNYVSSITKLINGNQIDEYDFTYRGRFLNTLAHISNDINLVPQYYQLNYYMQDEFPQQFSTKQDFWGYYNSNTYPSLKPVLNIPVTHNIFSYAPSWLFGDPPQTQWVNLGGSDRSADCKKTYAGALSKIVLPTGGSIGYEYSCNKYGNAERNGIRISKITYSPRIGQDITTNYFYSDGTVSTLDYDSKPYEFGSRFFILPKDWNYGYIPLINPGVTWPEGTLIKYKAFVSRVDNPVLIHSQDGIRYSWVEVKQGSNNGKEKYYFTDHQSNPDFLPDQMEFNTEYTNQGLHFINHGIDGIYTDNSCERGLLLKKEVYDDLNHLVQIVENTYDYHKNTDYTIKEVVGLKSFSHNFYTPKYYYYENTILGLFGSKDYLECSPCGEHEEWIGSFSLEYYKVRSRWITQSYTRETNYRYNGAESTFTDKYFYYDPASKKLTKTKSTLPDGRICCSYIKYSSDYNLPPTCSGDEMSKALYCFSQKHCHVPIQTINTEEENGYENITSGTLNVYGTDNTCQYPLLKKSYSIDLERPYQIDLTDFVNNLSTSDGNGVFQKSNLFKLKSSIDYYNDDYKPIQSHSTNGITESVQWDKYSKNVTAKFSNAKNHSDNVGYGNECSYTGFENLNGFNEEDTWSPGLGGIINTDAHTGTHSQKVMTSLGNGFSSGKDFLPDNQKVKYLFSAWVKTEAGFNEGDLRAYVHDGLTPLDVPQQSFFYKDGWQYVQLIIDLPSYQASNPLDFTCYAKNTDNVPFLIDDIRVQPLPSSAVTSTFDDQTREVTSTNDGRNIPQYYEYDGFGRAIRLRDKDKNILKQTVYNQSSILNPVISNFPIVPSYLIVGQNYEFQSDQSFFTQPPVTYSWTFGDGSGTFASGLHSYSAPGEYTVTLTIHDAMGATASTNIVILAANPLSATISGNGNFTFTPSNTDADQIQHDYSLSISGGAAPITDLIFSWWLESDPTHPITDGNQCHLIYTHSGLNNGNSYTIEDDLHCKITDTYGAVFICTPKHIVRSCPACP